MLSTKATRIRPLTNGPGVRRGTVRSGESVPAFRAQHLEFASIRMFGTMRTERIGPAESAANGLVSGCRHGAISTYDSASA